MGLLECASGASLWRGYDYYTRNKVVRLEQISDEIFSATVDGSAGNRYAVEINVSHPRKSKCNCPHADGRKIVCKHMIATYFQAYPLAAEQFYRDAMAQQEEEAQRAEELSDKVIRYVNKMRKSELQEALLQLLFDGPEWQFDRFAEDNGIDIE